MLNLNLTDSAARAIGITFVMNDVRSDADALLHNATVIAVSLSVITQGAALLISTVETNVSAIGGNGLTGQGTVFAKGGQSVANVVLASSRAIVSDSTITLTGDLLVQAINGALLDATLHSSFASGAVAVGIALAFNSIGWKASNILFNALETVLGDAMLIEEIDDAAGDNIEDYIGTQPAEAIARITGSTVSAANVSVLAENSAQLNATVSNAASSEAAALYGAEGSGAGLLLASNKTASQTIAEIVSGDATTVTVDAVWRRHRRRSRCLGSLRQRDARDLGDPRRTTAGSRSSAARSRTAAPSTTSRARPACGSSSSATRCASRRSRRTTRAATARSRRAACSRARSCAWTTTTPTRGSTRTRASASSCTATWSRCSRATRSGGDAGTYRYIGDSARRDLGAEDYTDAELWILIAGDSGRAYQYVGVTPFEGDLGLVDYSDSSLWLALGGDEGEIYEWMGPDTEMDLTAPDHAYDDFGWWKPVPVNGVLPDGLNISGSEAIAYGGLVVLNDVRASAVARIDQVQVEADGDVIVQAHEEALLRRRPMAPSSRRAARPSPRWRATPSPEAVSSPPTSCCPRRSPKSSTATSTPGETCSWARRTSPRWMPSPRSTSSRPRKTRDRAGVQLDRLEVAEPALQPV